MATSTSSPKKSPSYQIGGVVLVGCIMVGLGLGLLANQVGAGIILGIGIGFLAMAYLRTR